MTATAGTLKVAIEKLIKVHSGAALPQESLMQVKNVLRRYSHKHQMLHNSLSHHQRSQMISLLQEHTGLRSSTPASGAIFGILKQMKESFETNLADSQKEETNAAT